MIADFIPRVIPVLLLKGRGLYKGKAFKNHRYIGDPINIVKIFNDKEVDELVFLILKHPIIQLLIMTLFVRLQENVLCLFHMEEE